MHEGALHPGLAHVFGRCEVDDAVDDVARGGEHVEAREVGTGHARVNHLHVEGLAALKGAHRQAQGLAAAGRGQPQGLGRGDAAGLPGAARLGLHAGVHALLQHARHHDGVAHILVHARRETAGDVGRQAHMHALAAQAAHRAHAVGEVGVGDGAVRHGGSGAGEKLAVGFREEGAVRHDGLLAQKAEVVEGLRVGLAVTGRRHALLPLPLGAVRLHVGTRLLGDAAQAREALGRAAGDEARGHHAVDALARRGANLRDLGEQRLGVCQGLGRGGVAVEVGVGRRVVHDDLAHECALATLGADAREFDGGG